MELAKALNRLGTESAFSVLAEAKKLEAQGKPMIFFLDQVSLILKHPNMLLKQQKKLQMMDTMDMFYQMVFLNVDNQLLEK